MGTCSPRPIVHMQRQGCQYRRRVVSRTTFECQTQCIPSQVTPQAPPVVPSERGRAVTAPMNSKHNISRKRKGNQWESHGFATTTTMETNTQMLLTAELREATGAWPSCIQGSKYASRKEKPGRELAAQHFDEHTSEQEALAKRHQASDICSSELEEVQADYVACISVREDLKVVLSDSTPRLFSTNPSACQYRGLPIEVGCEQLAVSPPTSQPSPVADNTVRFVVFESVAATTHLPKKVLQLERILAFLLARYNVRYPQAHAGLLDVVAMAGFSVKQTAKSTLEGLLSELPGAFPLLSTMHNAGRLFIFVTEYDMDEAAIIQTILCILAQTHEKVDGFTKRLDAFEQRMNEGFDRLDQKLETLTTKVVDRLQKIKDLAKKE